MLWHDHISFGMTPTASLRENNHSTLIIVDNDALTSVAIRKLSWRTWKQSLWGIIYGMEAVRMFFLTNVDIREPPQLLKSPTGPTALRALQNPQTLRTLKAHIPQTDLTSLTHPITLNKPHSCHIPHVTGSSYRPYSLHRPYSP